MGTRWFASFKALDPRTIGNDGLWEVGISERRFKALQHAGHEAPLARLQLVQEVLQGGTDELWEGWSRPGKEEDCYVYVGSPDRDYRSLTIELPAPPGMAFLVFVLKDGTIDEWTWRPLSEDTKKGKHPDGIKGQLLWPLPKT